MSLSHLLNAHFLNAHFPIWSPRSGGVGGGGGGAGENFYINGREARVLGTGGGGEGGGGGLGGGGKLVERTTRGVRYVCGHKFSKVLSIVNLFNLSFYLYLYFFLDMFVLTNSQKYALQWIYLVNVLGP